MDTKQLKGMDLFISGTLLIALGIFVLNTNAFLLLALTYIFGIVYVAVGLFKMVSYIMGRRNHISILDAIFHLGIGIFLIVFPDMPQHAFAWLFGIYTLLLGITYGIHYLIQKKDNISGRLRTLSIAIFYIGFACFLGFSPFQHLNLLMNVMGTYFILYGLMFYKDLLLERMPNKHKDKIKRRIRISLPVFMQTIIPKVLLDEVNRHLIPSNEKVIDARSDFAQYKVEEKADVEIFIHASNLGFGKTGHVDVCIDDTFLSYGNYDYDSVRLNEAIGDGVLITCHKEDYIPFVIKDSQKILFCFGLRLNQSQKEKVIEQLQEIRRLTYEWKPPVSKGENDYYATRLKKACIDAVFHKFKKGKFKTYFVATTNCVQLVDFVVGSTGLDILKMNGIITPGAYYESLNRQFSLHNDMVIYKKIYN